MDLFPTLLLPAAQRVAGRERKHIGGGRAAEDGPPTPQTPKERINRITLNQVRSRGGLQRPRRISLIAYEDPSDKRRRTISWTSRPSARPRTLGINRFITSPS